MSSFLNDETGSVRWLCFELKGRIDFAYSKEVDINKVWSQAYHLDYSDHTFNAELFISDIQENEDRIEHSLNELINIAFYGLMSEKLVTNACTLIFPKVKVF